MNKLKLTVDSLLIAFGLAIVSCATQLSPTLESPAGRYAIHEKDTSGKVTSVYYTDKFTEHFSPSSFVSFIDSTGEPQKVESYDIYKL